MSLLFEEDYEIMVSYFLLNDLKFQINNYFKQDNFAININTFNNIFKYLLQPFTNKEP